VAQGHPLPKILFSPFVSAEMCFICSLSLAQLETFISNNILWHQVLQLHTATSCRVSGETGTYCEQPRHSEYGLDRFVVVQASSSTGLKAFLRPVVGKQTFLRPVVGKQTFLRPVAGKQSFYEY